eukprot:c37753_g1_i1 orf=25-234(+)
MEECTSTMGYDLARGRKDDVLRTHRHSPKRNEKVIKWSHSSQSACRCRTNYISRSNELNKSLLKDFGNI